MGTVITYGVLTDRPKGKQAARAISIISPGILEASPVSDMPPRGFIQYYQ